MSRSIFPEKQQTPMFAIRSCIADKANTVNRVEFENLKLVVSDAKTKCDQVVKKTNDVITAANTLAERTNLYGILIDKIHTFVYPTDTIVLSAMKPSEFIKYSPNYGVWGRFSGNWGWTGDDDTPFQKLTFKYHKKKDPNNPDEPDEIIEQEVPIYMYWCQEEEPIPEGTIPPQAPPPIDQISPEYTNP